MSVNTRPMTADEFLMMPDDGMLHELIRGEVTTMPLPGGRHGEIALEIGRLIGNHVKARRLGKTYAAETGFLIERGPDTVRGPDVSFVRKERLVEITHPEKHVPFAPDLAVEVVSPGRPARGGCRKGRDLAGDGRPDGLGRGAPESDGDHPRGRTGESHSDGGRDARGRRDPPRIHMQGQ